MKLFFEERLALFIVISCGIIGALCVGYMRCPQMFLPSGRFEGRNAVSVIVAGAVERPGRHTLLKGSYPRDAALAARPLPGAVMSYLDSRVPLVSGEVVYLPREGEGAPEAERKREELLRKSRRPFQVRRIDINQAGAEELASIPGVGEKLAEAIILRRRRKPFEAIDELTKVPGVGEKKYEKIKDYVTVGRKG